MAGCWCSEGYVDLRLQKSLSEEFTELVNHHLPAVICAASVFHLRISGLNARPRYYSVIEIASPAHILCHNHNTTGSGVQEMTPKDSKKTADHGVLCGLRSDTPADSSKRFRASLTKEPAKEPEFAFTPSPRPESLTLPFQNRERASHLITDEDMDRIMRQGELDDPMPRLPSTVSGNLTGLGLRRTLSTAQDLGVSLFTHRPRPASAHFGGTDLEGSASNTRYERSRYSRDPTLTALPRPPTKNDMAGRSIVTRQYTG